MSVIHGFVSQGDAAPGMEALDLAVTSCMAEHRIPGASLAVFRHGKPVYVRAFGRANLHTSEPVTPGSLFRIASISKPVTAVGILKLVEDSRLELDARIFDILPFDPLLQQDDKPDGRTRSITVRHCLNHTGGWDRARSGDVMFMSVRIAEANGVPPPAEPEHIMRWISGRSLDFAPGTEYAYSNYGYCLLGRVIEKLTGCPYDAWIRAEILKPMGINTMRIGRTLPPGRAGSEVAYYPVTECSPSVFAETLGERTPDSYGAWYVEAMDSHGGWIATAADIARFAAAFQDFDRSPVLSRASIEAMYSRPPRPVGLDADGQLRRSYYGLGWAVDMPGPNGEVGQQHHNGMLWGTAAVMRRRDDGISWSALFNRALGRKDAYIGSAIVPLMNDALTAIAG